MQRDTIQNTCCATDNTSNACNVPTHGQQGCNCASQANSAMSVALLEKPFSIEETRLVLQRHMAPLKVAQKRTGHRGSGSLQQNIRGGIMLGIACITSPCCTPLIVPVVLGLLAGTPVALWLTQNAGWLYGGLTLVSVLSLVVGLRWMWQKLSLPGSSEDQRPTITPEVRLYSTAIGLPDSKTQPVQDIEYTTKETL